MKIIIRTYVLLYIWYKMLFSSCNALLKLSKTTYPQKLFDYDYITLYIVINVYFRSSYIKGISL